MRERSPFVASNSSSSVTMLLKRASIATEEKSLCKNLSDGDDRNKSRLRIFTAPLMEVVKTDDRVTKKNQF